MSRTKSAGVIPGEMVGNNSQQIRRVAERISRRELNAVSFKSIAGRSARMRRLSRVTARFVQTMKFGSPEHKSCIKASVLKMLRPHQSRRPNEPGAERMM